MGDPAGDEAQRLEPLRLAQLVLDLLPLGDVEDEDEHGRATQVLDGAGQLLHLPDAAGKHYPVGDGPDGPGDLRRGLACGGAHLREIVGVDPLVGRVGALADELLRGHPGQLGHERVGVGDPSVLDDEDAGQRALGHLAELVLGVVTGGDVVEDADDSGGGTGCGRLEGEGDLRPEVDLSFRTPRRSREPVSTSPSRTFRAASASAARSSGWTMSDRRIRARSGGRSR